MLRLDVCRANSFRRECFFSAVVALPRESGTPDYTARNSFLIVSIVS
jgi:hypothetical protein